MSDQHRTTRSRRGRSLVLAAVTPVILVLSACGSTKDPATTSASNPGRLPGRYLVNDDAEHPLDLPPDGTAYTWQASGFVFRDRYTIDKDTVTLTGESCDGAAGSYRWSFDDDALVLAKLDDPCADRSAALDRRHTRAPERLSFTTVQPSKFLVQPGYNFATVDVADDVYTTDGKSGFYRYHQDGTVVASWPNALTYTVGITVDSQDNIYVALDRTHDHYVEKYSPDARLLATWATTGQGDGQIDADGATQVAVDSAGNSYVVDPINNRIVSFDPNGRFRYNITGDGDRRLNHSGTVAIDRQGNVYTDSGLTVWKFDRTGRFVREWYTPLFGPLVVDGHDRVLQVDAEIRLLGFPVG